MSWTFKVCHPLIQHESSESDLSASVIPVTPPMLWWHTLLGQSTGSYMGRTSTPVQYRVWTSVNEPHKLASQTIPADLIPNKPLWTMSHKGFSAHNAVCIVCTSPPFYRSAKRLKGVCLCNTSDPEIAMESFPSGSAWVRCTAEPQWSTDGTIVW